MKWRNNDTSKLFFCHFHYCFNSIVLHCHITKLSVFHFIKLYDVYLTSSAVFMCILCYFCMDYFFLILLFLINFAQKDRLVKSTSIVFKSYVINFMNHILFCFTSTSIALAT